MMSGDVLDPAAAGSGGRLKALAGLVLGAVILGSLALARFGVGGLEHWVGTLSGRARDAGPLGWVAFALVQTAVAVVGVLPASLIGIASGAVYGLCLGFALSCAGTLCGGWIAFALARSLLRPWVARHIASRAGGRVAELDAAVGQDGWRLVCLLRVSPVMPFALTSYALGLTHISARDYVLGTFAALPALLGYVAAGAMASGGLRLATGPAGGYGAMQWVLAGVGVLSTVVLIWRSGRLLSSCGLLPRAIGARPAGRRL